ncbi:hypothetical protein GII36_00850 [Candidatus Mycosynbacter amalyticus]|uniref:Uncharacterized protein n=1 Tax=Candidatus Mycosynbacter amalyticus TaxID=2665156 RepID=A0A857MJU0_9BACT|nr:hypothetical protein [Candidatus Mycosynbacter amalyticus]QHN42408.1 hypothetical protein GII36_00850 [Candidatus Mycosynbacter amalyticus]
MATERLMAAVPVEPVEVGPVDSWPSHITLVPWFDLVQSRWEAFDQAFQEEEIVWDLDARVHVVKKDTFGTDENPVTVSRLFGIMSVLAHSRTAGLVKDFGGSFDETYTGREWHAHITDKPGRVFEEGASIETSSIAIFQKQAGEKIIKQVYERPVITKNYQ